MKILPGDFDRQTFEQTRAHISSFINRMPPEWNDPNCKILEIGPQERSEVKFRYSRSQYFSLDIVDDYNPDLVGDLIKRNDHILDSTFDVIFVMEVLEHTLNPFLAVEEVRRMLKDGGFAVFSAPLNWRIHGPIPDCWRITEYGWLTLLKDWEILEIDKLNTPDRPLFPIKYNLLARCDKNKKISYDELKFKLLNE
jgi:SAM-dependent methyltransferase